MGGALGLVISLFLSALSLLAVARLLPGFEVRGGMRSALVVALVYGVLKVLLQKALILVSLPFVIVTFGAFVLVINAFLLWLTDKVLERFEIRSLGTLIVGTLLLTAMDFVCRIFVQGGGFF